MVEMSEVAYILNNATSRSLLILDEIGRGTSTFDGLSIAWAVIEYINDVRRIGARTLFATHYHELTELEGRFYGIKNYCVSVRENGEDIIFLRKIQRGGADGSYGIQVARLAGVPGAVLERAREILTDLEEADINKKEAKARRAKKILEGQVGIFEDKTAQEVKNAESELIERIKKLDITKMTPIDAMNELYKLQSEVYLLK
jgi:DNA mismatch repair protein MutS